MTNEEIIFQNRVFLMEQDVIKGIPNTSVVFEDENGKREVMMPEEIHTFNGWKRLGYQVQKGEKSVARFPIWKYKTSKKKEGEGDEKEEVDKGVCFMKVAFFFTKDQVKKIEVEA